LLNFKFKFCSTLKFVKKEKSKKIKNRKNEEKPKKTKIQENQKKTLDENRKKRGLQPPCMLMGRGPKTLSG
jgi:hypothetical protein